MAFRNIMLSSAGKLSCKKEQLIFSGENEVSFPLEDINSLLIENSQVMLSSFALQKLSEYGVCVYICDNKHLPAAVLLPYHQHGRQLKVLEMQLAVSKPRLKQLWQQIVIQKIKNQAAVLKLTGKYPEGAELEAKCGLVKSGDSTNIEALAAAYYFPKLFGPSFTRGEDSIINAALNYGYAILRGQVARSVAVHGLEPAKGIFHRNQLNRFNLVDDLIEVYRPVIDLYVAEHIAGQEESSLTPEIKRELFRLISCDVISNGGYFTVSRAIERTVQSYLAAIEDKNHTLTLCTIVPLEEHQYE